MNCLLKKNDGPIIDKMLQESIDRLHLSKKDIRKLWKTFKYHDKDRSGAIDVPEFFYLIREEMTPFGSEVFNLVDLDANGVVDFSEFVLLMTKYCLLGKTDILKFCFNVFDKDKSGEIDDDELKGLILMMHGSDQKSNLNKALDQIRENDETGGKFDFVAFVQINENYPLLLYPAFRIQESIMLSTFGEKWWQNKREELSNSKSANEILNERLRKAKVKRDAFRVRRKLQIEMGLFKFYCCPWKRNQAQILVVKREEARRERRRKREKQKKSLREKLLNEKNEDENTNDNVKEEEIVEDIKESVDEKGLESLDAFSSRLEKITNIKEIRKELKRRRQERQKALLIQ